MFQCPICRQWFSVQRGVQADGSPHYPVAATARFCPFCGASFEENDGEHTPGPWAIGHHQKLENFHTPTAWAFVKHDFPDYPYEGDLEEEYGIYPPFGEAGPVALASGEGNAQLIAAAPGMLAALEAIWEFLVSNDLAGCTCEPGDYSVGIDPGGPCETCQIQTAIAKAKGKIHDPTFR